MTPPMPAVVVKILVNSGDKVQKGDPLLVVSAMKMEHVLKSPKDGVVQKIHTKIDAQVMPGDDLIDIA